MIWATLLQEISMKYDFKDLTTFCESKQRLGGDNVCFAIYFFKKNKFNLTFLVMELSANGVVELGEDRRLLVLIMF